MVESVNILDTLRLEVMVGILEALRDACGGPKKFAPDIVSWLGHYAAFNPNDEISRKMHRAILILLLRVKLIRSQEIDTYFAIYMDAGRNMVWVELALSFVRQCLAEGLAATYEFASTFETVSKMRPANTAVRKQLQKWLTGTYALSVRASACLHLYSLRTNFCHILFICFVLLISGVVLLFSFLLFFRSTNFGSIEGGTKSYQWDTTGSTSGRHCCSRCCERCISS